MKYYSRLKVYKASNVMFNPEQIHATSYDWWIFVKVINGYVVFNWHSYSNSTRKHQYKVSRVMESLGIQVDLTIDTRLSLGRTDTGIDARNKAVYKMQLDLARKIETVFKLKPITQDEIQSIYDEKEENECNNYLRRALKYQERKEQMPVKQQVNGPIQSPAPETPRLTLTLIRGEKYEF
jgi:hypothetical protein